jgi:hypothetical protein
VVRFREAGGQSLIRDVFRAERKRLKYARLDEFDRCLANAHENLVRAIEEHEQKIALDREALTRRVRKASVGLGATIALSVLSVALPPLAVVSIPIAVWSAIVGGTSATDPVNEILTRRRTLKEIQTRPLGILALYRSNV